MEELYLDDNFVFVVSIEEGVFRDSNYFRLFFLFRNYFSIIFWGLFRIIEELRFDDNRIFIILLLFF